MIKRILLVSMACLPFIAFSQKTINVTQMMQGSSEVSKADTIITKDPSNPNKEYWTVHNAKGNLKAQGYIKNGKRDGVWREYNDVNGVIAKLAEYKDGLQHGALLSFNMSGAIQSEENFLNDKKDGRQISYGSFAGRIKLVENYKDGILDGNRKTYYEDGKVQEDGNYKNGKREGVVKWFLQNGNPTMEYVYENGNLHGPAKVYDEKGKLKQEGIYKNNHEEGEWKEYQDSVLVKKIIYKGGQIVKEVPVKK